MKALVLSETHETYMTRITELCEVVKAGVCAGETELSSDEVARLLSEQDPDILVVDSTPIGKEVLEKGRHLQLVICTRGNPVNIDKDTLDARGIPLVNTPARNANSVAEFTLGLIIGCMRHIYRAADAVRTGVVSLDREPGEIEVNQDDVIWYHPELPAAPYDLFKGRELSSSSLGVIGAGAIGRLVGRKASALGMKVLAYDPYVGDEAKEDLPMEFTDLETLSCEADVVTLHVKATPESFHLVDRGFIERMKPGACLINTSRGSLVNTVDLKAALREGRISCAALDVFEYEPLSVRDELLQIENLIVTPHISGASSDVIVHHSRMAWEAIQKIVEKKS